MQLTDILPGMAASRESVCRGSGFISDPTAEREEFPGLGSIVKVPGQDDLGTKATQSLKQVAPSAGREWKEHLCVPLETEHFSQGSLFKLSPALSFSLWICKITYFQLTEPIIL